MAVRAVRAGGRRTRSSSKTSSAATGAVVEEVDVVTPDDEVVGRATRAEVRERKLRHRAAYVLVFNSQGQLFVHRRAADKDVYPGYYDVAAGGVVVAGETYDDAARRELAEELGIDDARLRRCFAFRFDDPANPLNGMVYSCTFDGAVRLQREEIVAGEWVDLEAVLEKIRTVPFCPDGLEALSRYLESLDRVRQGT